LLGNPVADLRALLRRGASSFHQRGQRFRPAGYDVRPLIEDLHIVGGLGPAIHEQLQRGPAGVGVRVLAPGDESALGPVIEHLAAKLVPADELAGRERLGVRRGHPHEEGCVLRVLRPGPHVHCVEPDAPDQSECHNRGSACDHSDPAQDRRHRRHFAATRVGGQDHRGDDPDALIEEQGHHGTSGKSGDRNESAGSNRHVDCHRRHDDQGQVHLGPRKTRGRPGLLLDWGIDDAGVAHEDDNPEKNRQPGEDIQGQERPGGAHRVGPVEGPMPFVHVAPAFGVLAHRDHEGVREVRQMEGVEDHHGHECRDAGAGEVEDASHVHHFHHFVFERYDNGADDHRQGKDAEIGQSRAGDVGFKLVFGASAQPCGDGWEEPKQEDEEQDARRHDVRRNDRVIGDLLAGRQGNAACCGQNDKVEQHVLPQADRFERFMAEQLTSHAVQDQPKQDAVRRDHPSARQIHEGVPGNEWNQDDERVDVTAVHVRPEGDQRHDQPRVQGVSVAGQGQDQDQDGDQQVREPRRTDVEKGSPDEHGEADEDDRESAVDPVGP